MRKTKRTRYEIVVATYFSTSAHSIRRGPAKKKVVQSCPCCRQPIRRQEREDTKATQTSLSVETHGRASLNRVTPELHRSYTGVTPELHRNYTGVTPELHRNYTGIRLV